VYTKPCLFVTWTRRGLHSPVAKIWQPIFKVNAGAEENMTLGQYLYINTAVLHQNNYNNNH